MRRSCATHSIRRPSLGCSGCSCTTAVRWRSARSSSWSCSRRCCRNRGASRSTRSRRALRSRSRSPTCPCPPRPSPTSSKASERSWSCASSAPAKCSPCPARRSICSPTTSGRVCSRCRRCWRRSWRRTTQRSRRSSRRWRRASRSRPANRPWTATSRGRPNACGRCSRRRTRLSLRLASPTSWRRRASNAPARRCARPSRWSASASATAWIWRCSTPRCSKRPVCSRSSWCSGDMRSSASGPCRRRHRRSNSAPRSN